MTRSSVELDVYWRCGARPRCADTEPRIQVDRHDEHAFALRQSKMVAYEPSFLHLLFCSSRALFVDTGATPDPDR